MNRLRELLEKGVKVDARDRDGVTPLMIAAENGYAEVVRFLVERGADIEAKNRASSFEEGQRTALHRACEAGRITTVRLLLELGANPDCLSQSAQTPLGFSIFSGRRDLAMTLLEGGANPNGPANACEPPIVTAARNDDLTMIKELLSRGARPSYALFQTTCVNCARELLLRGADINAKDAEGKTPLLTNIARTTKDLLRCYIEAGADVNAKDKEELTPLMHLSDNPRIALAEMLLTAGADINAHTQSWISVLDVIEGDTSHRYRAARKELMGYLKGRGAKTGRALKASLKSASARKRLDAATEPARSETALKDDFFKKVREAETSAGNFNLSNEDIIGRLEKWRSMCSFCIVGASDDTILIEFTTLPHAMDAFAKEVYEFCPDIVDQGAACLQEMREYAYNRGKPVSSDLNGVDLEAENYGIEILKHQLEKQKKLVLWWD